MDLGYKHREVCPECQSDYTECDGKFGEWHLGWRCNDCGYSWVIREEEGEEDYVD